MTEVQADEQKPTNEPVTEEKPDENEEEVEKMENGDDDNEEEEKAEEEEEGDEDDDEGESSEEELGSLEKPVEILDRKRDRKSTERLTLEDFSETKKAAEDELDYAKGQGVKLGDIQFVNYQLGKVIKDELKIMHRVLYHKVGKATTVKARIRSFCGYPYEKDSTHYKRMYNLVDKLTVTNLKFIIGIIGLEKNGDRVTLRDRLIEYLMKPTDLEKPIPGAKKKEKKKPKDKKKSPKKKNSKPKKDKEAKSSETVSEGDVSSASDDSDDEAKEKKEKKVATPKKKKSPEKTPKKKTEKKETKSEKKKKSTPKQTAIKIAVPKKKKDASPKKRKTMEDSDDDDEPLVKKTKSEPNDAELRKVVSAILKDADLEQVTMKTVVKQVYEKYPEFDLTLRKEFIKTTVKEIIS